MHLSCIRSKRKMSKGDGRETRDFGDPITAARCALDGLRTGAEMSVHSLKYMAARLIARRIVVPEDILRSSNDLGLPTHLTGFIAAISGLHHAVVSGSSAGPTVFLPPAAPPVPSPPSESFQMTPILPKPPAATTRHSLRHAQSASTVSTPPSQVRLVPCVALSSGGSKELEDVVQTLLRSGVSETAVLLESLTGLRVEVRSPVRHSCGELKATDVLAKIPIPESDVSAPDHLTIVVLICNVLTDEKRPILRVVIRETAVAAVPGVANSVGSAPNTSELLHALRRNVITTTLQALRCPGVPTVGAMTCCVCCGASSFTVPQSYIPCSRCSAQMLSHLPGFDAVRYVLALDHLALEPCEALMETALTRMSEQ